MPGPVSIVIKALNEEAHIEDCLSSALWALGGIGGEVVLADSCSNDATTTVAMRYPVRIVQLARASKDSAAGKKSGSSCMSPSNTQMNWPCACS